MALFADVPHFNELLLRLHAVGRRLEASSNLLEHHWGVHLLEDWRSLELHAQGLGGQDLEDLTPEPDQAPVA